MKKFLMTILILILIILTIIVLFKYFSFGINAETVVLTNVNAESSRLSFKLINLNSSFFIKGYDYTVDGDTLKIKFHGTIFRVMSLSSYTITIDNAENIKEIRLWAPNNLYVTAWRADPQ